MMIKRTFFYILFLLLGLTFTTTIHAAVSCTYCGEVIEGRYMQYKKNGESINVCKSCDHLLPHCELCKFPYPHKNVLQYKGTKVCRSCFDDALFCSICEAIIEGRYYKSQSHGELYCTKCYHRLPRCKVCDRPTRPFYIDTASGACKDCLPELKRCLTCNRAIVGKYYTIEEVEGVFCNHCMNHRDKCYVCSLPVGDPHWKFPDGRKICDECKETTIIDETKIRNIMKEVDRLIRTRLKLQLENDYTLHVETLNNKSKVAAKRAKKGESFDSPLFGSELGLFRQKGDTREIFLLYGLPKEMIYETAAHEYAHAWQAENCVTGQSKELIEGFAQWVAAQVLELKGFKKTLEKLERRSDYPYGSGYKRIKKVEENIGRADMLNYVKVTRH